MPGEFPFSRLATSTPTLNPQVRKPPPQSWSQWPSPRLMPTSPQSISSPATAEWNKCSPPPRPSSAPSAGSLDTLSIAVPTCYPFVPSALSPTPMPSIAALTLLDLRVTTLNLSSTAARLQWRAVPTARKSTLCAAGIAPPAQTILQGDPRCLLDRCRTAWISLRTRLTLRRSIIQHPAPLSRHGKPQYCPAICRLLGRDLNVSSPTSSQERTVMNPSILTPPWARPHNGELFTRYTDSKAVSPSFPIIQPNCLGSWDVFLSLFHSFTMLPHPPVMVAIQDPLQDAPFFRPFLSIFLSPPPSGPTTGGHLYFSLIGLTPVMHHCLSRHLGNTFHTCFFS